MSKARSPRLVLSMTVGTNMFAPLCNSVVAVESIRNSHEVQPPGCGMLMGMPHSDDLKIERITDLDLSADELWSLISTAEGWRSWLVDEAQLDVEPHAQGTATEDGVVRDV